MKNFTYKIGTLTLSAALFVTCLSLTTNAQEAEMNTDISTEVVDSIEAESMANEHDTNIFELLPELESLSNYADSVESLAESLKSQPMYGISSDAEGAGIEISDVQIFRNSSDCDKGIQIKEGELKDQMIVKAYYDNGKSWVKYMVNPTMPEESDSVWRAYTSNSYGFTLPLDSMNLTSNLVCLFDCSNVSACSK